MGESSNSKWYTGIGGTIILGLATSFIYDWIKEKPLSSTIAQFFISIWDFILQILGAELKVWWIVVGLTLYYIGRKINTEYGKSTTPELPEKLKNYVRDSFTNWNWKWEWKWDGNKKSWEVKNLWPYCKKCEIKLLDKSDFLHHVMQCPRCKERFEYTQTDDYDSVKAVIYDNIERNMNNGN